MKKLIALLIVVMMFGSFASAQEAMTMKEGSKSWNFTFGGLGTFGMGAAGPSGGVGMNYFLNGETAVRAGLQIQSGSTTVPYTGSGSGTDGSVSQFGLGLSADYLMYMAGASSRVHPYWGGGIGLSMMSKDTKSAFASGGTVTEVKGGPGTGMMFDIHGVAGAEFFIYPEISLSGEYNLNLIGITSPSDLEVTSGGTTTTTKQGSSTNILGFSSAGAGIHIYF